jgi:uncharacterized repeat protein (TIGR03833 family)
MKKGTKRKDVGPGTPVAIIGKYIILKLIEKHNQVSGNQSVGEVKEVLTSSQSHHRGIKVRLTNGLVGRVILFVDWHKRFSSGLKWGF